MAEFLLESARWPRMPSLQRDFLASALPKLRADGRLAGLAVGGSFVHGVLDAFSDLDLVVVTAPEAFEAVLREGPQLAQALGPLLAAFTGEHVGAPQLLVCLYGPPLLHVDLKFVPSDDLGHRVEDPAIVWDRSGLVHAGLARGAAVYPQPTWQWIEDRIWPWAHYITVKIARGELFEALDGLGFIRARVLGPLILAEAGRQPSGVRRIEQSAPEQVAALRATLATHDRASCAAALEATLALYLELRERLAPADLVRRAPAERAARAFLAETLG